MPAVYPPDLAALIDHGRQGVKAFGLDQPYPQPELDRAAFVRQVRGALPSYLLPYLDYDPDGLLVPDDVAESTDFLFPSRTAVDTDAQPGECDGVLEAARHVVRLMIPTHAYPVNLCFVAQGLPGRPARWKLEDCEVIGPNYVTDSLAIAVALSTGDYPKGYEVK